MVVPPTNPTLVRRLADTEGAVFVEYVTLLTLVTIGAAAAFLSLGLPLMGSYRFAQAVLVLPFP